MRLTLRGIALTMVSLLALSFLIACGGGNDDADPTNTVETTPASPTAAASPDAGDDETPGAASPTGASEPSGSASPTATSRTASPTRDTSRPVATRSVEPTPTQEDDDGGDTDEPTAEEEALLSVLLREEDLPGGWTVVEAAVADDVSDDDEQVCGAGPFPQRDQKIAEVEGEYSFDDASSPLFLLQNLVLFPEDVAIDAMAWAGEASSCSEWVDDEGTTIQVIPLESPGLGDESHAVRFSFDTGDGQVVEGDWVFIRAGGMISTIAYLAQQGADLAPFYDIVVTATEKMESATATGNAEPDVDPEVQAMLLDMLLTQEEMPGDWTLTSSGPGEDDGSETAFCDVPDFPLKDTRLGDAEAEFERDPSVGPFLIQQITAFPENVVLDAMAYARETLSCSEWTDEETGYVFTVDPAYDPEIGDESVAVSFTLEIRDAGAADGEVFFVRVGNVVMAVTAIWVEPPGPGEVSTITRVGTEKIVSMLQ